MADDFDLSTFAKPVNENQVENPLSIPIWVSQGSETTKLLYQAVVDRRDSILTKIAQGESLPINERRIVNRQIAIEQGFDPSLITKRRQPDLVDFISETNSQLEKGWEGRRKRAKTGIKALSRNELEKEIKLLRMKNTELEGKFCRDSIHVALKDCFMENRLSLSSRIAELELELENKQQIIVNLRSELRKFQVKAV